MAFTLRGVRVPSNSASQEEARARVFDFFRTACRSIPKIIEMYNLHDVVTESRLRSTIASQIRVHSQLTNPKRVLGDGLVASERSRMWLLDLTSDRNWHV